MKAISPTRKNHGVTTIFGKVVTFLMVTLAIFSMSTSTFADKGEARQGKGKFAKILKELNLSGEQLEKLKVHRQENKGKLNPLRQEMKTIREELGKAFVNGATDSEIKALSSRMQDVRSKMAEHRVAKMIFFKNLLNAEQRKVWHEKKKSWKGKRGQRKKRFQ